MRQRLVGVLLVGCVAATAALLGDATAASAHPKMHTIHGKLELSATSTTWVTTWVAGGACQGPAAASDNGTFPTSTDSGILVKNASGKIIGTGRLHTGTARGTESGSTTATTCVMPFRVRVPKSGYYQLSITGYRGKVTYSLRELKRDHWHVAITF